LTIRTAAPGAHLHISRHFARSQKQGCSRGLVLQFLQMRRWMQTLPAEIEDVKVRKLVEAARKEPHPA
jgi:hypothetical protein